MRARVGGPRTHAAYDRTLRRAGYNCETMDLEKQRDEMIEIAARHGARTFVCSGRLREAKRARRAISICSWKWKPIARS